MKKYSEKVLVVPTKKLYQKGEWNGFRTKHLKWYRQLVNKSGQFLPRNEAEQNTLFKQIIPQILFVYQNKIYFHQIHKSGGESRLHGMYPIFLGGHVNPIDQKSGKDLLGAAAEREFFEEVAYSGQFISQKFVGLVNQTSGKVNHVHVGFVFIFQADSSQIKSKEKEVDEIGLLTISQLKPYVNHMTYWSKLVYPHLRKII